MVLTAKMQKVRYLLYPFGRLNKEVMLSNLATAGYIESKFF